MNERIIEKLGEDYLGAVAIIGMSGRFPGAKDMEQFWENLKNGVESVKRFTREELKEEGLDAHLLNNSDFVGADAVLDDIDKFDAQFFDYSAREAQMMDPQHRLFMEAAWEAMEQAGYISEKQAGKIAIYAGSNLSSYMLRNIYSNPGLAESLGSFKTMLANSQDFLATKVSYKFNFTGPSINVNTLCSSALVATQMACQSLNNYECDVAMAGGSNIQVSRNEAHFYQEGGIGAHDGHCRAFDDKASGTVSGSGVAIVVMKRLADALKDGDYIHAVIRGAATNNDGANKNSYTAPNADGQAECIAEAIAMSGINPETITYIEAHGTGTNLGDPIEIAGLTKAFRAYTDKKQYCAIGSLKTNIGHLVTAGGVASLIKTVESMKNKMIPASLNFDRPNPKIDFENSPFFVNTKLTKWERTNGEPLRAGVSSFGIGGTNAHVIVEEAPETEKSGAGRKYKIVTISAKSESALEKSTENLLKHMKKNSSTNISDVTFTLSSGRGNFNYRKAIVCSDSGELIKILESSDETKIKKFFQKPKEQSAAFIFAGEEGVSKEKGKSIYESDPKFRAFADEAIEAAADEGMNISLYTMPEGEKERCARSFVIEYSLGKTLGEYGITPDIILGKGAGEFAAAVIAGVMTLEDAVKIIASEGDISAKIELSSPEIKIISALSGKVMSNSEATDINHWNRVYNETSNIDNGLREIAKDGGVIFDVGYGNNLIDKIHAIQKSDTEIIAISVLGDAASDDCEKFAEAVAEYWLAGGSIDWKKYYEEERRCRVPLPTYPFERERYWIEEGKRDAGIVRPTISIGEKEDITSNVLNVDYKEGKIVIDIDLDGVKGKETALKEIIDLKKKIEELIKADSEKTSIKGKVSQVGLFAKIDEKNNSGSRDNLDKKERPEIDTPYAAPSNEMQKIIAESWGSVLGIDKVGINDDFFELGGDSLQIAAIAASLKNEFEVGLPMYKLLEAPTILDISEMIETYKWAEKNKGAASDEGDFEDGEI